MSAFYTCQASKTSVSVGIPARRDWSGTSLTGRPSPVPPPHATRARLSTDIGSVHPHAQSAVLGLAPQSSEGSVQEMAAEFSPR